ncbi:hypothetical protein, partial [Salmonella sp. s54395]|uniref:hypothetical protein n=1 Tax=Salmonella sp. s54395 TaxID=3159664 RepID=UPI00397F4AC2
MFWVERGWADIAIARDMDIYLAKTRFNVTAIAQETVKDDTLSRIEKVSQNITLAVTKMTSGILNLRQLEGAALCSAGIKDSASFYHPVTALIEEGIIPATGNVIESASDFFGDMCVP